MNCPNCGHEQPEIVLPDWYEILLELSTRKELSGLPPYEFVLNWLDKKLPDLSLAKVEKVAIAVKSKWGGKGWKNSDLYATFQNWCYREDELTQAAPSAFGRY